jgi:hypothetical protein
MSILVRFLLSTVLMLLALASCGTSPERGPAQLKFEAPMNVNSSQQWHVSLGVRNMGEEAFRDYEFFNGAIELRDSVGEEVSRIQVTNLWALEPGQPAWPAALRHELAPGAYTLTWNAPEHGGIVVDFSIVELDGWLYLGEEWVRTLEGESLTDERESGAFGSLVSLAKVNLAQRLGIDPEAVAVQDIEEAEFPDASLGAPEPGKAYAQVLTPGCIIKLLAGGETYKYHASSKRLAFVPQEGKAPQGSITITNVQVTAGKHIVVRGLSTLPDGTCLGTELWADGELQAWWPGETCVPVADGTWQLVVPLEDREPPAALDTSAHYMLRAFQQNGQNVVSVFAFDLTGPPTPTP